MTSTVGATWTTNARAPCSAARSSPNWSASWADSEPSVAIRIFFMVSSFRFGGAIVRAQVVRGIRPGADPPRGELRIPRTSRLPWLRADRVLPRKPDRRDSGWRGVAARRGSRKLEPTRGAVGQQGHGLRTADRPDLVDTEQSGGGQD